MTAEELLEVAIDYIAKRDIDRHESKDLNPDYFYSRGIELAAMQDLVDYLQEYVDEYNYNNNKGKEI